MNKNIRSIMFLSIVLIMILSITALSATDTANTTVSNTTSADTIQTTNDLNAKISTISDNEITKSNDIISSSKLSDGETDTTVTNYAELQTALQKIRDSTVKSGTITLGGDETTYTSSGSLVINTGITVTIDGNGKTIDVNEGQFAQIVPDNTLIIKDLTITNAKADLGAIINQGTLKLTNVTFSSNTANNYGGAIYSEGVLDVDNSTFKDNTVVAAHGGAIFALGSGTTTINNTIFEDNSAQTNNGGAIFSQQSNPVLINNSVFTRNSGPVGGAISTTNIINIYNSTFTSNTISANQGGAVFVLSGGKVTISGSKFNKNTAPNSEGGAVGGQASTEITITKSEFTENEGTMGGAIYTAGTLNIDESVFNDNSATSTGAGAICIVSNIATITGSNFKSNIAVTSGGAIYASFTKLTIEESYFDDNKAQGTSFYNGGGAIYSSHSNTTVTKSNFTSNEGNSGGAILNHRVVQTYPDSFSKTDVSYSNFTKNKATRGAAIYNVDSNSTVSNSKFTENTATSYGGAIVFDDSNATISNSNFTQNSANRGGAVDALGNIVLSVDNNEYTKNTATTDGGAIYIKVINPSASVDGASKLSADSESTDSTIKNTKFTENSAENGGAIAADSDLAIESSTFTNNEATTGSAITTTAKVTLTGSTVTTADDTSAPFSTTATSEVVISNSDIDNEHIDSQTEKTISSYADLVSVISEFVGGSDSNLEITLNDGTYTGTGLITVSSGKTLTINGNKQVIDANSNQFLTIESGSTVTINDLTIKNAKASQGAAISNAGTLTVVSSTFTDNVADNFGAAIYSTGSLTVKNSSFIANNVTNNTKSGSLDHGGAAIFSKGTLYVNDSLFKDNFVVHNDVEPKGDGGVAGAISIVGSTGDVTIVNSTFGNNTARHGGAITVQSTTGTNIIANNLFENNTALYGGALDIYVKVLVENNTFFNNSVSGNGSAGRVAVGGAITLVYDSADVTLKNNTLANNTATGNGGAIDVDGTFISINNTFANNSASRGGAINNNGGTITVTNTSFVNNSADVQGGAINNVGTLSVNDSSFIENNATNAGAITNFGALTVNDTLFENNYDTNGLAQTIYTQSNVTIANSTIITTGNTRVVYGYNAVVTAESTTIDGLKVDNGTLNGKNLDLNVSDYSELVTLINKLNTYDGSLELVVVLNGTTYTATQSITYSGSKDLTIDGNGKVIDANGNQFLTVASDSTVTIKNLTVTNAKASQGAAISNAGSLTVISSTFKDNVAEKFGATIYSTGDLIVKNSSFIANNVTTGIGSQDTGGAAIFSKGTLYVNDSLFKDNFVVHNDVEPKGDGGVAGAISIVGSTGDVTIANSTFANNTARHGGAITVQGTTGTNVIANNLFENNTALYGGALDLFVKVLVENNTFFNNSVSGNGSAGRVSMGGAISLTEPNADVTLKNNTLANNTATGAGGAIHVDTGILTSTNNTFANNSAEQGGAIDSSGTLSVENTTFINNNATVVGAITSFGTLTVNDTLFENNYDTEGLAQTVYTTSNVTIANSTIITKGNAPIVAVRDDSVVIAEATTVDGLEVSKGTLTDDDLSLNVSDYAELISLINTLNTYTGSLDLIVVLNGTTYTATESITYSGSKDLTIDGNGKTIDANNNQFLIIESGSTVTIKNLTVTKANADKGGVFYNKGTLNIENSTFTGNKATTGAVIYSNNILNIKTSVFTDNSATNGVIYLEKLGETTATTTLTNNTITGNDVGDSAIITHVDETGSLTLSKNIINSNKNDNIISSKVTVSNDLDVVISVDKVTGKVNDEISIDVTVTNDYTTVGSGNVSLMNGTTVLAKAEVDSEGKATIKYTFDKEFTGTLTIAYDGFNVFNNNTQSVEFEIVKREATITADDISIEYGSTGTITAEVTYENDGVKDIELTLVIKNGDNVVKTLTSTTNEDGKATFEYDGSLDADEYSFTISFTDDVYTATEKTGTLTVTQVETNTTVADVTVDTLANTITITAEVKNNNDSGIAINTGKVTFTINGTNSTEIDVTNGQAILTISHAMLSGEYTIVAVYDGNDNIKTSRNESAKLTVNKVDATLTSSDVTVEYGSKVVITAELKSGSEALADKELTLVIENGETDIKVTASTDADGKVEFNYTTALPVKDGGYSFTVSLADDIYTAENATGTLTVTEIETKTTVEDVTANTLDNTITITAKVENTNTSGINVNEGIVTFTINGTNSTIVNVVDGVAELNITNAMLSGEYPIVAVYSDTNGNIKTSKVEDAKLVVSKVDATLTTDSVSVEYGSKVVITAELKYNDEALADKELTLVIDNGDDDITLSGSTDANGKVEFNYTEALPVKDGGYSFTINLTDDIYASSDATGTLTITQIETTISVTPATATTLNDNIKITVKVENTNKSGINVNEGIVTFTINGTNSTDVDVVDGVAELNITPAMLSGEYPIVAVYTDANGNIKTSEDNNGKLTVSKVTATVTVDDLTIEYGSTGSITAKVEYNNVGIKDINLKLVIENGDNDVELTATTGEDGKATFSYDGKLDVKTYTLTVSFTNDIYEAEDATGTLTVTQIETTTSVTPATATTLDDSIEVTANVKNNNDSGIAINTGKVTFTVNGENSTDVNVVDGVAKLTINHAMLSGEYTIVAVYDGNDNIKTSKDEAGKLTVSKVETTSTVDDLTIEYGSTGSITAKVEYDNAGVENIVLTLIIRADETVVKTLTATTDENGIASFDYGLLDAKVYDLNVSFTNDIYEAKDATGSLTVTPIETTTEVANVTATTLDSTITITANVKNNNESGIAINTGKVTFTVNGVNSTDVNVENGQATLTINNPMLSGEYTIVAVYDGNDNIKTSKEENAKLTVNKVTATISTDSVSVEYASAGSINAEVTYNDAGVKDIALKLIIKNGENDITLDAVTDADGKATFNYDGSLSVESYDFTIGFTNDIYNATNATGTLTVTPIVSKTTVNDVTVTIIDDSIVIKATIENTNTSGVSVIDKGVVTFTIDDEDGIDVTVVNGVAQLNLTGRTEGTYNIKAVYTDSTSNIETSEDTATLTVNNLIVNDYSELKNIVSKLNDYTGDAVLVVVLNGETYTEDEAITYKGSKALTINGNGKTINANGKQFLTVASGSTVTINSLIVEGAQAEQGAAIINEGTLVISEDSKFNNNKATHYGGAIYNTGSLTLNNVAFTNNEVTADSTNDAYGGGAIYSTGELTITSSNFTSNKANNEKESPDATGGFGGAIYAVADDKFTINESKFNTNIARDGGAIYITATSNDGVSKLSADETEVNIADSEFTGNKAVTGGAIEAATDVSVEDTTFTSNTANTGSTIATSGEAVVELTSSKIDNVEIEDGEITIGESDITITSYADLVTVISNIESYQSDDITIKLDNGEYTWTQAITISPTKKITIDGNSQTINANGNQFLTVSEGSTVTINGLTVSGAKADKGAAIINSGSLTIANSVFANNEATTTDGGAIYNGGNAKLTITTTKFNNNKAATMGGAIASYDQSELTIKDSLFTSNEAIYGGAIVTSKNLSVNNTTFTENKATAGGAIFGLLYANMTVDNTTFTKNSASSAGGAIYTRDELLIMNSTFDSNTASVDGGAIKIENNTNRLVTINTTNFTNNNAQYGGAIITNVTLNISDSEFIKNSANDTEGSNDAAGGAIYVADNGVLILNNTKLTENTAPNGGAVYNNHTLIIVESNFAENEAGIGGAVFTSVNTSVAITDSVFDKNTATSEEIYMGGGAIFNKEGNVTATGTNFTNNKAYYGGAINNNRATVKPDQTPLDEVNPFSNLVLDDCIFYKNEATVGGAISGADSNATIKNSNFTENTASVGGAIDIDDANVTVSDTTFTNNNATVKGGAVRVIAGNLNTTDVIFDKNTVGEEVADIEVSESVITTESKVLLKDTVIEGLNITAEYKSGELDLNVSDYDELANLIKVLNDYTGSLDLVVILNGTSYTETTPIVYNGTKALIIDGNGQTINADGKQFLTVTENSNVTIKDLTVKDAQAEYGAAIRNNGTLTIINSTFDSNKATESDGGAIYNVNDGKLIIIGTKFTSNKAAAMGGAIASYDQSELTVIDSIFSNNEAIYGGAIVTSKNLTVNNTTFTENKATAGGAIFGLELANITVDNSTFKANTAESAGGAIYTRDELLIMNSTFEDNTAGDEGGAIKIENSPERLVTINTTNFTNNNAKFGGAIMTNVTLNISDSQFIRNSANDTDGTVQSAGGAVYVADEAVLLLNNVTLTSNSAGVGGAIYNNHTLIIVDSTFNENKATIGGAVYTNTNTTVAITDSVFDKNVATSEEIYMGGGAIFNKEGNITATGTNFTNNKAYYGGAINNNRATVKPDQTPLDEVNPFSNLALDDCVFENNSASYGGAISGADSNATIKNSKFTNNTASVGGAIDIDDANVTVDNTNFTDNNATVKGGAVRVIAGNLNTTNVIFDNNTVDEKLADIEVSESVTGTDSTVLLTDTVIAGLNVTGEYKSGELDLNASDYDELAGLIKNITDNYVGSDALEIILNGTSYTMISPISITTGKEIIINGNGRVIDANGNQFLTVGEDANVLIKDLTVINAKATDDAVIDNDGTLAIIDSSIIGGIATSIIDNSGNLAINNTVINDSTVSNVIANTGSLELNSNYIENNTENIIVNDEEATFSNNVVTTITNIDDIVVKLNEESLINITLTSNVDGIVIRSGNVTLVDSDNNNITTAVVANNGTAVLTYTFTQLGNKTYTVVYEGFNVYGDAVSNNFNINVIGLKTTITSTNITGITGETITINATIVDENDNKVNVGTIKVYDSNNNIISSANVADGAAQIEVAFSQYYNDTLTLVFDAVDEYLSSNATINAYIKTNTSIIKIDDVKVGFGSNATVTALLVTDDSIIVSDATLSLADKDGNIVASGKTVNGIIVFNYTANVSVGNYTYTILFEGNDTYATSNVDVSIEITPVISTVSVEDVNVKVGDNTTITANVTNSLDPSILVNEGKVKFTINETLTSEVDVVDGVAQYNITDGLSAGTYNVTVEYLGTTNITTSNTTGSIVVDKRDVQIEVISLIENPTVGDENKIFIIAKSDDTLIEGEVNLTINGNTVTLDLTEGTVDYSYDVTSAGNESIVVSFIGDDTYNTNSSIVEVEVAKAVTTVKVQTVSTTLNTTVLLNASVTSENNTVNEGTVTFYVNDTLVGNVSVANNEATTQYIAGSIGNFTIKAVYSGSDNYNASENTNTLVVTKVTPTVTISPIQTIVGENTTIKVYVFANGLTVNDGVVTITAGNVLNATSSVTGGVATITRTITNVYNGTLTVKYTNSSIFNDANNTTTLTVTKASTSIKANNITGIVNTATTIRVNITSSTPVSEGNVTVRDVNGKLLANGVVKNGTVNLTLGTSAFNSTYNSVLIVNYTGSTKFESSVTVVKANISRLNASINTVRATSARVGANINISVNIIDSNKANVTSGQVQFVYNNSVIGTANVSRGNASIVTKFTTTANSVKINYIGGDKYSNATKTVTINATRLNSTVRVSAIKARIGDNITLSANVTDSAGNKVNYGTVYFRINGTNIKYTNGTAVTASVVNGTAKAVYMVPSTWNGNVSKFSAYYSSPVANTSSSISSNVTVNVTTRPVDVTFFTDSNSYYTGDKINVRVVITDNGVLVNGGTVTFKFNGVTLKYTNGSTVQVAVKDGVASVSYTLPSSIGAGNHTFNIVFGGGIYQRYEATTKISVLKTDVHVEVSPIIATGKTTRISARVYDGHNTAIKGTTKVSIKIAGSTFVSNANITNGVISFTVNTNFATGLYDVSISVGENSYYKGTKIDTKLLKT